MSELFNKVINASNEGAFNVAVRNWIEGTQENPFELNTPEHDLFFKTKRYYQRWRAGGIDCRSAKRNMYNTAKQLVELHDWPTTEEPKNIEELQEKNIVEETSDELNDDVRYVMDSMLNAYNKNDIVTFEQDAIHLADIAKDNPFKENTTEYVKFNNIQQASNKKALHEAAKELCDAMNGTETYPIKIEPSTRIFGVLPEKKNRRRRKEGNSNDGQGTN